MIRREGRVAAPPPEAKLEAHPRPVVQVRFSWETRVLVVAVVVLLILAGIYGMNWMLSLFPWAQ